MIVITGPGRSGTSALAKLYLELGFDPGGGWRKSRRAGLEQGDVWRLNNQIAKDLGVTMVHPLRGADDGDEDAPKTAVDGAAVRSSLRRKVRRVLAGRAGGPAKSAGTKKPTRVRLTKWDRFDAVVDKHRDTIIELAGRYQVVKDPRFSWTMPVWLAAEAPIEHITISTRAVPSMVASR